MMYGNSNCVFFGRIKNNEHLLMSLLEKCKSLVIVLENDGKEYQLFLNFIKMLNFYNVTTFNKLKVETVKANCHPHVIHETDQRLTNCKNEYVRIFKKYKNYVFIFGSECHGISNLSSLFLSVLKEKPTCVKIYKEPCEVKNFGEIMSISNADILILPNQKIMDFYTNRYNTFNENLRKTDIMFLDPDCRSFKFKKIIKEKLTNHAESHFTKNKLICLLTGYFNWKEEMDSKDWCYYDYTSLIKKVTQNNIPICVHARYGSPIKFKTDFLIYKKELNLRGNNENDINELLTYSFGILSMIPNQNEMNENDDIHYFRKLNIPNRMFVYDCFHIPTICKNNQDYVMCNLMKNDYDILYDDYDELIYKINTYNENIHDYVGKFGTSEDFWDKVFQRLEELNLL